MSMIDKFYKYAYRYCEINFPSNKSAFEGLHVISQFIGRRKNFTEVLPDILGISLLTIVIFIVKRLTI